MKLTLFPIHILGRKNQERQAQSGIVEQSDIVDPRDVVDPHEVLRYHVTGAIERGEAVPIVGVPAVTPYDALVDHEIQMYRARHAKFPEGADREFAHHKADNFQAIKGKKYDPMARLNQFATIIGLMNVPPIRSQDGKGDNAYAYVKLFDPCGAATWYITESEKSWKKDGDEMFMQAFGWCDLGVGFPELGYVDLVELSRCAGKMGIGMEIDMHWKPKTLKEIKK